MKLLIEVDLNHPEHVTTQGAFACVFALMTSIMDTAGIPPEADLRRIFEVAGRPDADFHVICEGASHQSQIAVSRVMVMKAPFANHLYAQDQSRAAGVEMKVVNANYNFEYDPSTGIFGRPDKG